MVSTDAIRSAFGSQRSYDSSSLTNSRIRRHAASPNARPPMLISEYSLFATRFLNATVM